MQDSLVRTRQLNRPELSGYVVDIILQYLRTGTGVVTGLSTNTGVLTGVFYPRPTNPSGYVTSGVMTGYATRQDLSGNNVYLLSYVDNTYYQRSNPSGFVTLAFLNNPDGGSDDNTPYFIRANYDNYSGFNIYDVGVGDGYVIKANPGQAVEFGNDSLGRIISLYNISRPNMGGFISGLDIYTTGINGETPLTPSIVGATYIPWWTVGGAWGDDSFRELAVGSPEGDGAGIYVKSDMSTPTPYLHIYGVNRLEPSSTVILDAYGDDNLYNEYPTGRPLIGGFDIYSKNIRVSGYDVLTRNDISFGLPPPLATYSQLLNASGILHSENVSYKYSLTDMINQMKDAFVIVTGEQLIDGIKKFTNSLQVGLSGEWVHVLDVGGEGMFSSGRIWFTSGGDIYLTTADTFENRIRLGNDGGATFASRQAAITSGGIFSGDASMLRNVVFTTGIQTISGAKTFDDANTYARKISNAGYGIDLENHKLIIPTNRGMVDWYANTLISRDIDVISLNWLTRKLFNLAGQETLDWENRTLSGPWTISGQSIATGAGGGGGGGGSQTPWTGDIDAASNSLSNVDSISALYLNGNLSTTTPIVYATVGSNGVNNVDLNRGVLYADSRGGTLNWYDRILSGNWTLSGTSITTGGPYLRYPIAHNVDFGSIYAISNVTNIDAESAQITEVTTQKVISVDSPNTYIDMDRASMLADQAGGTLNWSGRILSGNWTLSGQSITTGGQYATLTNLYNSGNALITGINTQSVRITQLSGMVTGGYAHTGWVQGWFASGRQTGLVYTTGNQVISGDKTFTGVTLLNVTYASGIYISGKTVTTGGPYYPLLSNPSGYLTSASAGGVNKLTVTGYELSGNIAITGAGRCNVITGIGNTILISGTNIIGLPTDGSYGGTNGPIAGIQAGDTEEDALDKIDVILGKLAPSKPANLSSAYFAITGTTFSGRMQGTSTVYTGIVASLRITGTATGFYDADAGILSGAINGALTGARLLSTSSDVGTYTGIQILTDKDYWQGVAGKAGFWNYLDARVFPTGNLTTGKVTLQLFHSQTGPSTLLTGYCDEPSTPTLTWVSSGTGVCTTRMIDGIVSFATNDQIRVSFTVANAISAFYAAPIARFTSSYTATHDVNPTGSPITGTTLTLTGYPPISNGVYSTGIPFTNLVYNSSRGQWSTNNNTNFRVDTVSNRQSQRRTAGTGQFPTSNYNNTYDDTASISGSEELQMINGAIQYPPSINYGFFLPSGKDYSKMPSGTLSGYRWSMFDMGSVSNVSAVRVTFNNASNFGSNTILTGFCLYVRISGATNGWVDGNAAYIPGNQPTNDGDRALDMGNSNATGKRITFGTQVLSGPVYIRVGLRSGQIASFGTVTMEQG